MGIWAAHPPSAFRKCRVSSLKSPRVFWAPERSPTVAEGVSPSVARDGVNDLAVKSFGPLGPGASRRLPSTAPPGPRRCATTVCLGLTTAILFSRPLSILFSSGLGCSSACSYKTPRIDYSSSRPKEVYFDGRGFHLDFRHCARRPEVACTVCRRGTVTYGSCLCALQSQFIRSSRN